MSNQKDTQKSKAVDKAFTDALAQVGYLHDMRTDIELGGGSFATMQPVYERAVDEFADAVIEKYGSASAYVQDLNEKIIRTATSKGVEEKLDPARNGGRDIGAKDLDLFDRLLCERAEGKPDAGRAEKKSLFSFFAAKKPESEWDRHREGFGELLAVNLPQAYFQQMRRLKELPDAPAPAVQTSRMTL